MQSVEDIIIQGRELGQFVTDFTWYLRNLLLVRSSDDMEDILDMSSENIALLKEEAQMIDTDTLMRYIRIFSELSNQVKYASQKRVLVEIAMIKLCRPQMEQDTESILDRLNQLEKKMEQGIPAAPMPASAQGMNTGETSAQAAPVKKEYPKAMPEDIQQVVQNWNKILMDMVGVTKNYLKHARLSLGGDNVLLLVLEDEMAAEYLNRPEHKAEIESAITERIQSQVEVRIQQNETNRPFEQSYVDLQEVIHMDVTIEDE